MSKETPLLEIMEHIDVLRKRLMWGLLVLVVTTGVSLLFAGYLIEYLATPIGGTKSMVAIEVTENISVYMKVSLLSGFIFASPVILALLLDFIMPGLSRTEKRWVFFTIPFATLLFLSGVAFSFYIMLPAGLKVLLTWMNMQTQLRPNSYFDFVLNLMFWVGVVFETPLFVFMLARLHFINARMLSKQWRLAIVICAILAAVITPTGDPVNMGLLMAPLFILYLLSIFFARLAWPEGGKAVTSA